ncbi:hypothetical protein [Nitratireductor sp. GCM10026969]|uniref:hypothetical protein n=1 Tax=Nitratireductor sp. GCM10026969 TaxID=3252645 RepID=UPI0036106D79
MNEFAGYTRPLPCGGHWAMLRFARDARPKPLQGEGGRPIVFPSEIEALRAVNKHLLAYFNGELRRDGETLSTVQSAANALFPTLVRQKGSSRLTKVETVRRRA